MKPRVCNRSRVIKPGASPNNCESNCMGEILKDLPHAANISGESSNPVETKSHLLGTYLLLLAPEIIEDGLASIESSGTSETLTTRQRQLCVMMVLDANHPSFVSRLYTWSLK